MSNYGFVYPFLRILKDGASNMEQSVKATPAYDGIYNRSVKRILDFCISGAALLVLWPFYLVIALLIALEDGFPVLYRAPRGGYLGKDFRICKFRTMVKNADKIGGGTTSLHDPRITKVGNFLRKTKLDEIPQLGQVFLGKMSLVGPRPPLPSEVRTYTLEERKRLNITPGITCLWQVSGRSELPFKQQMALDKEYIASRSAWKDFLILLKTIPAILTGKGAW